MVTLTLPSQERRVLVRSFWVTLSALTAVPVMGVAWWFRSADLAAGAVGTAVLLGLMAFLHEDVVWRVYRSWNRRLVHPFSVAAAHMVMRICYFIVFVAVGMTGSRLSVTTHDDASWRMRGSLPRDAYHTLFAAASPNGLSAAWIRNYLRWAIRTGNVWSLSLLPFLALLKLLALEEEKASPANIYTLF